MFPEAFRAASHEISSPGDSYLLNTKLPFPIKLHEMLEEMAQKIGDESIVSWQPHGMAFRVHLPEVFARTVMSRYFKQTKYKSFQRQLHLYGFRRILGGMDKDAYFHSMFIRNKKSMSLRMTRQKIKGKKPSNAVHHYAAGNPDFYSSATNVDNNQCQDGRSLTNTPHSDPIILQTYTTAGASTWWKWKCRR